MQKKIIVRANPVTGHNYRWCAQRPWGSEPRSLVVREDAGPGGAAHASGQYEYNFTTITPADLAALKADPHIVVIEDVDAYVAAAAVVERKKSELDAAKAAVTALEQRGT